MVHVDLGFGNFILYKFYKAALSSRYEYIESKFFIY